MYAFCLGVLPSFASEGVSGRQICIHLSDSNPNQESCIIIYNNFHLKFALFFVVFCSIFSTHPLLPGLRPL